MIIYMVSELANIHCISKSDNSANQNNVGFIIHHHHHHRHRPSSPPDASPPTLPISPTKPTPESGVEMVLIFI